MTTQNDNTGDRLANVKGDRKKFESGWDAIWGNKSKKDEKSVDTPVSGGKIATSSQ